MKTASRADLLAAAGKRRFDSLDLPICGLTVRYRSLSELELSQFEMESLVAGPEGMQNDEEAVRNTRARLIVRCLVDDSGALLLNEADVDAVNGWDATDSALLYDRLRDFIGLSRRVREAQAAKDEAKKNSNTTTGDDSPTG